MPSVFQRILKPIYFVSLFAIVALGAAGYFYYQYSLVQKKLKTASPPDQNQVLISQISKLMELPPGETPTIASVTDKDKLQNQPFFTKAQNGDRVLIYVDAKKAILFRPSLNKIIDVAPVNISSSSASPTP